MDAETLDIARRLVACKGWVWLPGMIACDVSRPTTWRRRLLSQGKVFGWKFDAIDGPVPRGPWHNLDEWVPDLDDDLTRLGVLAVVRRAYRDDSIGIAKFGSEWAVTVAYTEIASGDARMAILRRGPTELAALLAALEAAPHG